MGKSDLSILVVGAGAVGGITAALLKKAGHNVEVAVRTDEYAAYIRDKGIEVNGVCGNHIIRIPSFSSVHEIREKKDIILLTTKASEMISTAKDYEHLLNGHGCFVSLQNGMCEDELVSVMGQARVIGCVTGWGATMESHGKLIMTSNGDFVIGYPGRKPDHLLHLVADTLSAVVPVKVTENISGHKYSKLIINSCITSPGAICGLYLGKMLSSRKMRRIFIEIIREAVAVSEKMHIKVGIFAGKIDFPEFVRKNDIISDFRRHLIIRAIGFKYRRLKSSSLQSLERGQQTEVDYLNGYIVKQAALFGVDVPVNEEIVRLIHEIEAGKRQISPTGFDEPLFSRFN